MFWSSNKRKRFARKKNHRRLRSESLESRQLMAVFTVTSDAGVGAGSLREAIQQSNQTAGLDTIAFSVAMRGETISLRTALPEITEAVTIEAPWAFDGSLFQPLTIDSGGRDFRPLSVASSAQNVTIRNLNLTGGSLLTLTGEDRFGGGFFNAGLDTVLENVEISGNEAHQGGGIYNEGSLTILDSVISDNLATSSELRSIGGGIFSNSGTLVIDESTIQDNNVLGQALGSEGGGIAIRGGIANITSSSIVDNEVADEFGIIRGGGISASRVLNATSNDSTDLFITASTIRKNSSGGDGGGIYSEDVETFIVNSTIADNNAINGTGGGVYLHASKETDGPTEFAVHQLNHNTITGNSAQNVGGVFSAHKLASSLSFSVIAENFEYSGVQNDIDGSIIYLNGFVGETDGDPMLGPLGDNGGPTWTRVPLPGSPLLERVSPNTVTFPNDQRGKPRVVDSDFDGSAFAELGAVEFVPQANLSGQVLLDDNGDGLRDSGEIGLDGWRVQLFDNGGTTVIDEVVSQSIDLDGDGQIDPATESGLYEFTDVDTGTYDVRVALEPQWVETALVDAAEVVADSTGNDLLIQPARQLIYPLDSHKSIPVPTSQLIHIPVFYDTTDGGKTTGLGLRVHFDSSLMTYERLGTEDAFLFNDAQVLPDLDDEDNDPSTDQYILVSFIDDNGQFPTHPTPSMLFGVYFSYNQGVGSSHPVGDTNINFTPVTTDPRYGFAAESASLTFFEGTFDVDANGHVDALTDGMLISRYLLGATGDDLTQLALAKDAQRTNPDEIIDYLDAMSETMLDANGDGRSTAFGDGVVITRFMLGYQDDKLLSLVAPGSTRTTGAVVSDYLEDFLLPDESGAGGGAVQTAAEAEQVSSNSRLASLSESKADKSQQRNPLPGSQHITAKFTESTESDQLRLLLGYQTNPVGLATAGLATRVHFNSEKLRIDSTKHFADNHVLDQVFEDTEDWDNNPETDRYLLSAFVDANENWKVNQIDQRVSQIDFEVLNDGLGAAEVNVTSVESPIGMEFEGTSRRSGLSHTNPRLATDVNLDGKVTALDALLIINQLSRNESALPGINPSPIFVDVNSDEHVTSMDALWVINELARRNQLT